MFGEVKHWSFYFLTMQFITLHVIFSLSNSQKAFVLQTTPLFLVLEMWRRKLRVIPHQGCSGGMALVTPARHWLERKRKKAEMKKTPGLERELPAETCRVQVNFYTCSNGAYNQRETDSGLVKVNPTALVSKYSVWVQGLITALRTVLDAFRELWENS